jgi:hypothetical protein
MGDEQAQQPVSARRCGPPAGVAHLAWAREYHLRMARRVSRGPRGRLARGAQRLPNSRARRLERGVAGGGTRRFRARSSRTASAGSKSGPRRPATAGETLASAAAAIFRSDSP